MKNIIFELNDNIILPIQGSKNFFPVNQIYCVGRNYSEHAKEMGADEKDPPFFFTKPNWTLTRKNVAYPQNTENLQHEVELVIAIGKEISIFGFGVGVDLTKRDVQSRAKKIGKPWFSSKSFVGSSPISEIVPISESDNFSDLELKLSVNGKMRQHGSCSDMIWSPIDILSELKSKVPLSQGDLIYTGTPKGVGSVNSGDIIDASIPYKTNLSFKII